MNTGTVKFYNRMHKFGFITPEDSGTELFFHATDVTGSKVADGDKVEYEIGEGRKGIQAKNVSKIKSEVAPEVASEAAPEVASEVAPEVDPEE